MNNKALYIFVVFAFYLKHLQHISYLIQSVTSFITRRLQLRWVFVIHYELPVTESGYSCPEIDSDVH